MHLEALGSSILYCPQIHALCVHAVLWCAVHFG